NKININIDYSFSYDTLALFGGLDTNKVLNDIFQSVLYETVSTSKSSRYQLTYNNQANVKILALLIPNIKSDLTFYFNSTSQKYFQNTDQLFENMTVIVHGNYYQTLGASFRNLYEQKNVSVDLIANYETTNYDTDVMHFNNSQNVFTLSGEVKYFSKNEIIVPSVFGKYSIFNGKTLLGFGADITSRVNNNISLYAGLAWFQQQVTLLESNYPFMSTFPFNLVISYPFSAAENNSLEMGIKFNYNHINGKLTYFNYHSKNNNVPYMNQSISDSLLINELSYFAERDIKNSGINANINLKIWNILFSNNISYYFSTRDERVYASPDYTLAGKLYYMDLLFENNLNLKTGINYRYTGGQLPFIYDFEKSLQITSDLTPMVDYSEVPSSFQLDLFMAGTIKERATIFVTLENVLDTEYYIVPYYFKQPITLRFGVSWLLYD
ncbi:MAG: hypothetical protein KKF21_10335, partial [Bacteroidetes bacterium]|nr:hypothetical protein [Bacteroidota bacterium]